MQTLVLHLKPLKSYEKHTNFTRPGFKSSWKPRHK